MTESSSIGESPTTPFQNWTCVSLLKGHLEQPMEAWLDATSLAKPCSYHIFLKTCRDDPHIKTGHLTLGKGA